MIHPTAIVSPDAQIGKNVEIGPYAVIEDNVKIGDNCYIDAHVKICRYTTIGSDCCIYMNALVGAEPQDHRFYRGLISYCEIGHHTVIREFVTIHRPPFEQLQTVVGNHVLLMAFVHVAHDVVIGDHVTIANHTSLSGHVQVGDGAVDHKYWQAPEIDAMVRPAFFATKELPTTDDVSEAAVALAINYYNFKDTDDRIYENVDSIQYKKIYLAGEANKLTDDLSNTDNDVYMDKFINYEDSIDKCIDFFEEE